jgi:class 3 adenylate cyclase
MPDQLDRPYDLLRRFLLVVLPLLAVGLVGLVLALSQALSAGVENAYQAQTTTWHARMIAMSGVTRGTPWTDGAERARIGGALETEAREVGFTCATILDAGGKILAGTAGQECASLSAAELRTLAQAGSLLREEDGSPTRWTVASLARESQAEPVIVVTSEPSEGREKLITAAALPWMAGLATLLFASLFLGTLFVIRAQSEINSRTAALQAARASLARFVPQHTRDRVAARTSGVRRLTATVLFLDIRDFSSFAEASTAEQAAALVSDVASIAFDAVIARGGDVDRLVGDGLVARFDGDERVMNAFLAARDIMVRLRAAALPRAVGIGIHDGVLVEAAIGVGNRMDATILGSTVNIAARLCALAAADELVACKAALSAPEDIGLVEASSETAVLKGHTQLMALSHFVVGGGADASPGVAA